MADNWRQDSAQRGEDDGGGDNGEQLDGGRDDREVLDNLKPDGQLLHVSEHVLSSPEVVHERSIRE